MSDSTPHRSGSDQVFSFPLAAGAKNMHMAGRVQTIAATVHPVDAATMRNTSGTRYSICTLVTRPDEYAEMLASFVKKGFNQSDCEFLYLDNSSVNRFDAYSGCNLFLSVARGDIIILCHQDVRLEFDDRLMLEAALADLDRLDKDWALCGNAGGVSPGRLALRITDPHGEDQKTEGLPIRVQSLDENFIIVKREANLALSHDLSGFHLYGADLCLIASILGRTAYAIDFHLRHRSGGAHDDAFNRTRSAFVEKYLQKFRPQWVTTTCTVIFLSSVPWVSRLMNRSYVTRLARRVGRVKEALRGHMSGWTSRIGSGS
jgi:hypothetical protein